MTGPALRSPCPLNQAERPLAVADGTLPAARAPAAVPAGTAGPLSPATGTGLLAAILHEYPYLARGGIDLTAEEQQALIEHKDVWDQILLGLERQEALRKQLEPYDFEYALSESPPAGSPPNYYTPTAGPAGARGNGCEAYRVCETYSPVKAAYNAELPGYNLQIEALYHLYDKLCISEYRAVRDELKPGFVSLLKERLAIPDQHEAWRYYQWVRRYYVQWMLKDRESRKVHKMALAPHREGPHELVNEVQAGATFLDLPVAGGVHPDLAAVLSAAEANLKAMPCGAYERVKAQLRSQDPCHIGGFVPRPLNNLTELSYHGLGRAIDINWETNPFFTGPLATAADDILKHAHEEGLARTRESLRDVVPQRRKRPPWTEAELVQAYQKMRRISEAIQGFLRESLDEWVRKKEVLKRYAAITVRVNAAYRKRNHAIHRLEEQQRRFLKSASPRVQMPFVGWVPGDPTSLPEYVRLKEEIRKADEDLAADLPIPLSEYQQLKADYERDRWHLRLTRYQLVERFVNACGKPEIETARRYRDEGMTTLPFELFLAMYRAGARSGIQYEGAKDVMHFEVLPKYEKPGTDLRCQ